MSWDRAKVFAVVAGALASTIAPAENITPSAWAAKNLVVPDGPHEGSTWDPALTPQLVEIMDQLSPDSPANAVSLRKSAQLGATTIGIAWSGYVADIDPAPFMTVMPTLDGADGYNREKLHPAIVASAPLRRKIFEARTRSSRSSTARTKRFAGGSIILTGANSAADLRSKTRKYLNLDEVDEWPLDLAGQGDPFEMAVARQLSYRESGDWKRFATSTPTIKGASRIDAQFEAGDQRFWMVRCPHCGGEQRLEFGGRDAAFGLKFNTAFPYRAHYVCRHGGCVIEHSEKPAMVRAGRWVATNPGPGRDPSYHLDTLTSLLVGWDDIADAFLKAGKNPEKLKTFTNLWLGMPWEERGDAPDWQRLYARRADYPAGVVPHGGLVLTAAVDVQGDGLYCEVVAWGRGERSWTVEARFLPGDTAKTSDPCWLELDRIYNARWPMASGGSIPLDLMGVDSGFNTNAVYAFVRPRPKAMALKGVAGWTAPPIGTPSKLDVSTSGKKKRRGLQVWPVGTWALKAKFYGFLRQPGIAEGEETDPEGYCHFGQFLDRRYFQQLTAEYIAESERKGHKKREWVARGENHYHDCRVYNQGLAWHLKLDRLTDADWAALSRQREAKPDQGDMVALMNGAPEPGRAPAAPAKPSADNGAADKAGPEGPAPQPKSTRGRRRGARVVRFGNPRG